jgi:hypothetical protein
MTTDDNEGIRGLLHAYCHHVDSGHADEWADLFTEDGTFDVQRGDFGLGDGHFAGRAELRGMASHFRADGLHVSTNPMIDVNGDEATVSSYVLVLEGTTDPRVRMAGRYEDRLRKVDGRWRFASRRLVAQMQRRLDS